MATLVWHIAGQIVCDRTGETAQLLEKRLYPADSVPDVSPAYQILARTCSLGSACQVEGYACRWTGVNPNYDPFGLP